MALHRFAQFASCLCRNSSTCSRKSFTSDSPSTQVF